MYCNNLPPVLNTPDDLIAHCLADFLVASGREMGVDELWLHEVAY